MTDTARTDLESDLAFVKAMAEEGRNTPLVNGSMYVLWGGLISAAALLVYADAVGLFALGPLAGVWPWVGAIGLGWAISFFLGPRSGAKPGASTLGNQTAMAVWFSVGLFITLFWVTLMVVHDDFTQFGVPPYFLFGLMFPLAFGLMGVALFATATAARVPWLRWVAVIAWGASVLSLATITSAHQILIGAVGMLACSVVPGLILMRSEPSEIV